MCVAADNPLIEQEGCQSHCQGGTKEHRSQYEVLESNKQRGKEMIRLQETSSESSTYTFDYKCMIQTASEQDLNFSCTLSLLRKPGIHTYTVVILIRPALKTSAWDRATQINSHQAQYFTHWLAKMIFESHSGHSLELSANKTQTSLLLYPVFTTTTVQELTPTIASSCRVESQDTVSAYQRTLLLLYRGICYHMGWPVWLV